jgi:hypothetical protein
MDSWALSKLMVMKTGEMARDGDLGDAREPTIVDNGGGDRRTPSSV